MEKTKAFYLVAVLAVSALLLSTVNAQIISEEARRHMARGQAAVEMAKSPDEYDSAINEFQQASRLAPDWPDPYFQLAKLQEKTGKLKEAVASLKTYLRLAPNAPDAAKIQEQIYKLEFKAEQVITDDEVLNIFVSLTDSSMWQLKGITNANVFSRDIGWVKWFRRSIWKQGYLAFEFYTNACCPAGDGTTTAVRGVCPGDALPMGKVVEFKTFYCLSEGSITSGYEYRLEVVSRNKVKMTVRVRSAKELGGRTEDASYEFVRR